MFRASLLRQNPIKKRYEGRPSVTPSLHILLRAKFSSSNDVLGGREGTVVNMLMHALALALPANQQTISRSTLYLRILHIEETGASNRIGIVQPSSRATIPATTRTTENSAA